MLSICVLACSGGLGFVQWASTSLPPERPFDGWVHVLVDGDDFETTKNDHFLLNVEAIEAGGSPTLEYTIIGCGRGRAKVLLLTGGSARLSNPQTSSGEPFEVRSYDGVQLTLGGADAGELGFVDVTRIDLGRLPACSDLSTFDSGDTIFGVAASVRGEVSDPIYQQSGFLGIPSPRAITSMPLVGAFPTEQGSALGEYGTSVARLPKAFVPAHLLARVHSGDLGLATQVESSRPDTANSSQLVWTSQSSLQPSAQLYTRGIDKTLSIAEGIITLLLGLFLGLLGGIWANVPTYALEVQAGARHSEDRCSAVGRKRLGVVSGLILALALIARRR